MDCKFSGNSIKCDVICKPGYETAITGFLSLQCHDKQWLRKNNDTKYVRVANANSAPRCYGMCWCLVRGGCTSLCVDFSQQCKLLVYLNNVIYFLEPKQKNPQTPYCQEGYAVVQSKDLCGRMDKLYWFNRNLIDIIRNKVVVANPICSHDITMLLQPYYNMTISVSLEQLCIKITYNFAKYKITYNFVSSL